jgi:hypothetical protein
MPLSDLMRKLISCGAVKMKADTHEPNFTPQFKTYLGMYAGLNRDKITVIQGWRAMLAGFDMSLAIVSDEEIATLVKLLEYQLNATRSASVSN